MIKQILLYIYLIRKEVIPMHRRIEKAFRAWLFSLILNTLKTATLLGVGIAIGMSL